MRPVLGAAVIAVDALLTGAGYAVLAVAALCGAVLVAILLAVAVTAALGAGAWSLARPWWRQATRAPAFPMRERVAVSRKEAAAFDAIARRETRLAAMGVARGSQPR